MPQESRFHQPQGESGRCGPDFFAAHTLTELEGWSDHALEEVGRLTEAMRHDRETDKYLPVGWEDAKAVGKKPETRGKSSEQQGQGQSQANDRYSSSTNGNTTE